MTGEIGEIIQQSKPPRVLVAENYVRYQLRRLLEFCDAQDVCFEEVLEQAEVKFLAQVDPEGTKDGLPEVQER